MFTTKVAQKPTPVKELIEIAWEATRGRPMLKAQSLIRRLYSIKLRGQFHLLLDVPASRARSGSPNTAASSRNGMTRLWSATPAQTAPYSLSRVTFVRLSRSSITRTRWWFARATRLQASEFPTPLLK